MDDFRRFWEILCEAFPEEEHRSREDHEALMTNPAYEITYIRENSRIVGFYSLWDLGAFVFMEHFAFDAEYRGKGLGAKYLQALFKELNRPLVLEVEVPATQDAKRRIAFYEAQGLHFNRYAYVQPPLQVMCRAVPMHLMSWPQPLTEEMYHKYKKRLYHVVYDIKNE